MTTYSLQHPRLLFFGYTYRAVIVSIREPGTMFPVRHDAQYRFRILRYDFE
jgi:hypothetical protein